jgi:hypothetical protein
VTRHAGERREFACPLPLGASIRPCIARSTVWGWCVPFRSRFSTLYNHYHRPAQPFAGARRAIAPARRRGSNRRSKRFLPAPIPIPAARFPSLGAASR